MNVARFAERILKSRILKVSARMRYRFAWVASVAILLVSGSDEALSAAGELPPQPSADQPKSRAEDDNKPVPPPSPKNDAPPAESSLPNGRNAAQQAVQLVQAAAGRYPEHRQCFSCHHQTLPLLAMTSARAAGLDWDQAELTRQADFTARSFAGRREAMNEGRGVGGTSLTVGYGLWAWSLAQREPDETTAAMVQFLLKNQRSDGSWHCYTSRPPQEDSNFTCTVLACLGLRRFSPGAKHEEAAAAIARAAHWLAASRPQTLEDYASRLWGLAELKGEREQIDAAREALLMQQHDDGGWPQLTAMSSDAYATGLVLYVLTSTGLSGSAPACQRGREFLLRSRQPDGSWWVKSRSKPIQTYFDNGDPHGHDQFISTPSTAWAAVALMVTEDTVKSSASEAPSHRIRSDVGTP